MSITVSTECNEKLLPLNRKPEGRGLASRLRASFFLVALFVLRLNGPALDAVKAVIWFN